MTKFTRSLLALAMVLMGALTPGSKSSAAISAMYPTPTLDRWNYNFNGSAGAEALVRAFSAFDNGAWDTRFDNRDSEVLLGWNTSPTVPSGLGTTHYRVISARMTTMVGEADRFVYDPTFDLLQTYFVATDAEFVADADAGRPLELYIVGYKNGWSLATYAENSPYAPGPPFQTQNKGFKNVFAAQYSPAGSGMILELSNNVDGRFEARPIGVGQMGVAPGTLVPVNTTVTFDLDMTNPDTKRYLREGLNFGRVNLMISSLVPSSQGNPNNPKFYSKESAAVGAGTAATFEVVVCVAEPGDWDCSGVVEVADIFAFLGDWFSGVGDMDEDGVNEVADIFTFLNAWFTAF